MSKRKELYFFLTLFYVSFALGTHGSAFESAIGSTEQKLKQLTSHIEELWKEMNFHKEVHQQLVRNVTSQERLIKELTDRVNALERRNGRKKRSPYREGCPQPDFVAFSAHLNRELANLGPDHIVPFQTVELNEGDAYNNHTGIFTSPKDGVYIFTFSVEDYRNHRIWFKLVVDGKLKANVVEWSNHNGHNAHGSNTVFLRLKIGQSVWVAVDSRESGASLQGWPDLKATTFAGAYLHP